jgi:hypothetical protein
VKIQLHARPTVITVLYADDWPLTRTMYEQLPAGGVFGPHDMERSQVGEALGEIWGWVNLCPTPECAVQCRRARHYHVIAQVNGKLRQEAVPAYLLSEEAFLESHGQLYVGGGA